jgi:hypothetical protein
MKRILLLPALLLPALLLLAAAPAAAQQRAAPFEAALPPSLAPAPEGAAADTTEPRPVGRRGRRMGRLLTGMLGWTAGALAGANLGAGATDCCGDDPGLVSAVYGGLLGAALGSGAGAALPDYGSECTFEDRFWRGSLGSLGGTALALLLVAGGDGAPAIFLPIGGGLGAALAADC